VLSPLKQQDNGPALSARSSLGIVAILKWIFLAFAIRSGAIGIVVR